MGCTSSITPIPATSRRLAICRSSIRVYEEDYRFFGLRTRGECGIGAVSDSVQVCRVAGVVRRVVGQLFSATDGEWGLKRSVVCGFGGRAGLLPVPQCSVVPVCYAGSGDRETGLAIPVSRRRHESTVV